MDAYGPVLVHVEQLDVAPVGDQAGADAVEERLDLFTGDESGLQLHLSGIGKTPDIVEYFGHLR